MTTALKNTIVPGYLALPTRVSPHPVTCRVCVANAAPRFLIASQQLSEGSRFSQPQTVLGLLQTEAR